MSILKYTDKYFFISVFLIVIVGISMLVIRSTRDTSSPSGRDGQIADRTDAAHPDHQVHAKPPPPGENEDTGHWDGDVWHKTVPKVNPRQQSRINTTATPEFTGEGFCWVSVPSDTGRAPQLPRHLKKRLDKVQANGNNISHPRDNPNYYQEVYDAVCEGLDPKSARELLKKHGIYTTVILEHMSPYEAFEYIRRTGPGSSVSKALAIEYGKRVIAEDPKSSEALNVGLRLALEELDPHRRETYYGEAVENHPDSRGALFGLGNELAFNSNSPDEAILYLKKATRAHSKTLYGDYKQYDIDDVLGVAYSKLGDYKTAWTYFKKASQQAAADRNVPAYNRAFVSYAAIEAGNPLLSPVQRVSEDSFFSEEVIPSDPGEFRPSLSDDPTSVSAPPVPETPHPVAPPAASRPTPEEQRAIAAKQAFDEMRRQEETLRRQQAAAAQKELDSFLDWAASIMRDTPLETNNFLAKELERHLIGQKTRFDPDQISRAFEMMERYRQNDGMKRLQKNNPALAKEVMRMLSEKNGSKPSTHDHPPAPPNTGK